MATDDELLEDHSKNIDAPSVLRFYGWSPYAISLGYHQRQIPDHWESLAQNEGLDLVSRPSGGRAVLHKGDLTYALITRSGLGTRSDTYRYICEFLIKGLAELGINLNYGQFGRGYIHNPSCFSTSTGADLVISDGRKLIGSAQVYRHGSVLQHGSIAIHPDRILLRQLFKTEVPVVGLSELLCDRQDHDTLTTELIQILTNAAAKHFDVKFDC